jgi:hypothetical protein
LLLSAAGVSAKPADFDLDKEIESFPKDRRLPKFAYKIAPRIWKKKVSPFGIMRKSGNLMGNYFLKGFAKKRLDGMSE